MKTPDLKIYHQISPSHGPTLVVHRDSIHTIETALKVLANLTPQGIYKVYDTANSMHKVITVDHHDWKVSIT